MVFADTTVTGIVAAGIAAGIAADTAEDIVAVDTEASDSVAIAVT